ncbi:hypothetical protein [Actinoplanes sp. NPDC026619]|uniref:hypothetical protein n=1 Tax=Actinoplanes sp. NPDC026619 TaxID=3155798 RepID=UPI0033F9D4F9
MSTTFATHPEGSDSPTQVITLDRVVPAETSPPARRDPVWRILPWVVPALVAVVVLHRSGTPDRQTALYAAYFAAAVMLPGTLVMRGLFGSRGNWPEDLGLGAAAGMVVQLTGWALAAATGLQSLLPVWPVLVVLPFLLVGKLRRHWRIASPQPLPVAWSWGVAAALVLAGLRAVSIFQSVPLPPVTFTYYQDILYHLGLVHEMMRSMPFQAPQVAGDTLRYHYLSDADMAAASMITHISPETVYFRLWLLPVVATAIVVFAALARTVSRRWWAGPVAALAAFAGEALSLGGPIAPFGASAPVSLLSPSQTYVVPLLGLFALVAIEALRGRRLGWAWAVLPLLAVACAGSKSSALPPLLAGVALAGLALLVTRRRMPWTAAGLLATIGFGMVVGLRLFAGGGAGTLEVQPLGLLRIMAPYQLTLGGEDGMTRGGLLPPGVAEAGPAGRWFVAGIVLWWVLMEAPRLLGVVLPARRTGPRPERDAGFWVLAGMVVAGVGATWVFWHPSASQGYFFAGIIPIGAVLTVCALAERTASRRAVIAAGVAGAVWVFVGPATDRPIVNTLSGWAWALARPLLITAAVTAVACVIVIAIGKGRATRALPAMLIAAIVGATIATGAGTTAESLTRPQPPVNTRVAISKAEMRAAFWLDTHAGRDDLVATNVHCMPIDAKKVCDARGFWVTGFGGRRALIESWGYSDASVAANGVNGLRYTQQPAPDRAVFDLNQRAFATGDVTDVERLRDEYGVRWLFADTRAGPVADALTESADLRLVSGTARIYEIRPAA